ncbi:MAG: FAD-binding protein [Bacteroidota bacterium]
MASVDYYQRSYWRSFHEQKRDLDIMIKVKNDRRGTGSRIDRYIDTNRAVGKAIDDAIASRTSLRMLGGRWSMSDIAHEKDSIMDTRSLNIKIAMKQEDLDETSTEDANKVFLFQCGNDIKEINKYLKKRKLSLSTCGASNGQTIAGAISTGTHGAAMNFGCIQDFVVGLHIIVGSTKNYIIERASVPVISKSFAESLNAELVRDENLFNAALVSMGSFGYIAGVFIRTEDIYLLDNYVFDLKQNEVKQIFEQQEFDHPSIQAATGYARKPDHFKLFVNPYDNTEDIRMEIMYKLNDFELPDIPEGNESTHSYHKDVLSVIEAISDRASWTAPLLLRLLKSAVLPKKVSNDLGTLGQHFSDTKTRGRTFSCAMGISIDQIWEALTTLREMFKTHGPIPALISMRLVKGTKALLGWTNFALTCVLEIDGVQSKKSRALIQKIPAAFDDKGIAYTFHWGKMNPMDDKLVKKMYGNSYDEWIRQRSRLMSEEEGMIFSSDHTIILGLGEYVIQNDPIDVVT